MDTWRATNADKMATNSGQEGELQPCKYYNQLTIQTICHRMLKLDIKKRLT